MNKLTISIIIFIVGFSTIAKAQNANNSVATETVFTAKPSHSSGTNTKENLVDYKSRKEKARTKSMAATSSLQYDSVPEKTTEDDMPNTNAPIHKSTIPQSKTVMKYVHLHKVEEQHIIKDN